MAGHLVRARLGWRFHGRSAAPGRHGRRRTGGTAAPGVMHRPAAARHRGGAQQPANADRTPHPARPHRRVAPRLAACHPQDRLRDGAERTPRAGCAGRDGPWPVASRLARRRRRGQPHATRHTGTLARRWHIGDVAQRFAGPFRASRGGVPAWHRPGQRRRRGAARWLHVGQRPGERRLATLRLPASFAVQAPTPGAEARAGAPVGTLEPALGAAIPATSHRPAATRHPQRLGRRDGAKPRHRWPSLADRHRSGAQSPHRARHGGGTSASHGRTGQHRRNGRERHGAFHRRPCHGARGHPLLAGRRALPHHIGRPH